MGEELRLEAHPVDYGLDMTLRRQNLARTPAARIAFMASFANFVERHRGVAIRAS